MQNMERAAGILLPLSSLASPGGIGTMGVQAQEFIDFLQSAGQRYWQMLPIGPVSYGDSPYQSFSAFAGNPYFIDPAQLVEQGLVSEPDWKALVDAFPPGPVDYAKIYQTRFPFLRRAFAGHDFTHDSRFQAFCEQERDWLDDYALYMALKGAHDNREWLSWDTPLRLRQPDALAAARKALAEDIQFYQICQYLFFQQWFLMKSYANQRGILLIGDMPIYVALDSADVYAHRDQFELDSSGQPTRVAGVPPDDYSPNGQRWGNPLYNWKLMQEEDFSWWRRRVSHAARLFDVIRIDHFIGTTRYFAIDASSSTAKTGVWEEGPGMALIHAIMEAAGSCRIVAEDLGVLHPRVQQVLHQSGLPGMKVLLFAFSGDADNDHLPHRYTHNNVVYVGTHDNQTAAAYVAKASRQEREFLQRYTHTAQRRELPHALIRLAYSSVADTAIIQAQDLLGLGEQARMNTPSTLGGNWKWRLLPGQLTEEHAFFLYDLSKTYGRLQNKNRGESQE